MIDFLKIRFEDLTIEFDGNSDNDQVEAVQVVKHVEFLIGGDAPLKTVLWLLGHPEGRIEAGAGDAFGGYAAVLRMAMLRALATTALH